MIIIGTKIEIDNMVAKSCPHMAKHTVGCDQDCLACWNKAASIVIVRPEMIGRVKKDIDGVSFLERLKGGEEVQNPCDTCKNVGDCEPCEKMREGEQE